MWVMETSLRYGGGQGSTALKLHAKHTFPVYPHILLQRSVRLNVTAADNPLVIAFKPNKTHLSKNPDQVVDVPVPIPVSRRSAFVISILPLGLVCLPQDSVARERRRKAIPLEDYLTSSADGLKYYDVVEGKGPTAEKGSLVQVHFDCQYRGITAISTRESKLLAGNRSISQPYEFRVGAIPGKERKRNYVDNPNGLFSAQAAPKPPPAMYSIVEGMKVGGKRTVIIPPEVGYGKKGMNEIPPDATFDLNLELLQVTQPQKK